MNRWLIVFVVLWSAGIARAEPTENADFENLVGFESEFQQLLHSPSPQAELTSLVQDKLLPALYRIEHEINRFETELDAQVILAKHDPLYRAEPLRGETYQKILFTNLVATDLSHKLEFFYQRLRQAHEASLVLFLERYLADLPHEDRLQLWRVLKEMKLPAPEKFAGFEQVTRDKAERLSQVPLPFLEEEPANKPITPSPEAHGNVDGSEFPDGIWSFTFDDGPHPQFSIPLMKALKEYRDTVNTRGAPATFFWLAGNVLQFPEVVKQGNVDGFSLNCHSWTHAQLGGAPAKILEHEVNEAVAAERKVFARPLRFFRCPYGYCDAARSTAVRTMLAKLGLIHAQWSVDSLDWKLMDAHRSFNLVVKQMLVSKHGIILMHDIHRFSVDLAKLLLDWVKKQNDGGKSRLTLLTVDAAVDLTNRTKSAADKRF